MCLSFLLLKQRMQVCDATKGLVPVVVNGAMCPLCWENNLNGCNAGISCIQLYSVSHCPLSVLEIVYLTACLLHGYLVLSAVVTSNRTCTRLYLC